MEKLDREGLEDVEFEYTCGVCFELFEDPRTLPCSHSICNDCIVGIYKRSPTCPFCRAPFGIPLPTTNEQLRDMTMKFIREMSNQPMVETPTFVHSQDAFFFLLPPDMFREIFWMLSYTDLGRLACVCKMIQPSSEESLLWRELCTKNFPFCDASADTRNWKGIFQRHTQRKIGWDHGRPKDFKMTPWRGHTNYVNCFDLYRKSVVSGGADNKLFVWNFSSDKPTRTLSGHNGCINCVKFNEIWTISGSQDSSAKVWDTQTGNLISTLQHTGPVESLLFNDKSLYTASTTQVRVWDVRSSNTTQTLQGAGLKKVEYGPNNSLLAYDTHGIKIWDLRNGQAIANINLGGITCMSYAGENRLVAATSTGNLSAFNVTNGQLLHTTNLHHNRINCLSTFGDKVVTGSADNTLKVFNLNTQSVEHHLVDHTGPVNDVQMDQQRVVSGSADGCMKVWQLSTGKRLYSLLGGSLQQRGNNPPHPTRPGCSGLKYDQCRIVGSFNSLLRVYSFDSGN